MIREFVLQMKLGHVHERIFPAEVRSRRAAAFRRPVGRTSKNKDFWNATRRTLQLSRDGLLQVDRLLHEFFLPQHRNVRYS